MARDPSPKSSAESCIASAFAFHRRPRGGKRKWSPQRTVHGNKAKARIEMEKYRSELEEELNNEHSMLKVGAYAREFHERRKTMASLSPLLA